MVLNIMAKISRGHCATGHTVYLANTKSAQKHPVWTLAFQDRLDRKHQTDWVATDRFYHQSNHCIDFQNKDILFLSAHFVQQDLKITLHAFVSRSEVSHSTFLSNICLTFTASGYTVNKVRFFSIFIDLFDVNNGSALICSRTFQHSTRIWIRPTAPVSGSGITKDVIIKTSLK